MTWPFLGLVIAVVLVVAAAVTAWVAWHLDPPPELPSDLGSLLDADEVDAAWRDSLPDVNVRFRAEDLPEYRSATAGIGSIVCPRCSMRSYNPNDVREGYCGACHDYTRTAP